MLQGEGAEGVGATKEGGGGAPVPPRQACVWRTEQESGQRARRTGRGVVRKGIGTPPRLRGRRPSRPREGRRGLAANARTAQGEVGFEVAAEACTRSVRPSGSRFARRFPSRCFGDFGKTAKDGGKVPELREGPRQICRGRWVAISYQNCLKIGH